MSSVSSPSVSASTSLEWLWVAEIDIRVGEQHGLFECSGPVATFECASAGTREESDRGFVLPARGVGAAERFDQRRQREERLPVELVCLFEELDSRRKIAPVEGDDSEAAERLLQLGRGAGDGELAVERLRLVELPEA